MADALGFFWLFVFIWLRPVSYWLRPVSLTFHTANRCGFRGILPSITPHSPRYESI